MHPYHYRFHVRVLLVLVQYFLKPSELLGIELLRGGIVQVDEVYSSHSPAVVDRIDFVS